ncbi:hypothetical protein [Streptomyces sp. NPDC003077]|uniref:hypothetical protein n=1 Tax=Streptomyces sp. NPDC003077 TaxID=3154443 RepID=UPI0033B81D04
MDEDTAGRVVTEGVKFVVTCAQVGRQVPMAPSRVVDEGWHALLLHSQLYADLCGRFGEFVHHYPGYDPTHYDPEILSHTREMITKVVGEPPDPDLWGPPTEGLATTVGAQCQHSPPDCAIRPMPKPEWP